MTPSRSSPRSYSDRTLKILWGRAAGRCAVPDCRVELLADATNYDPIVIIGDIAHIEAASELGPRGAKNKSMRERDEYDNLILLCKNCHVRLDGQKRTNTIETIRQLRNDHEAWVRANLPERGRGTHQWRVVLLQGIHPINKASALAALSPDSPASDPAIIAITAADQRSWETVYDTLSKQVASLFSGSDSFDYRFAIFPLALVSACVGFGYLLTSRPHVRLFQYKRDEKSWIWANDDDLFAPLIVSGLPGQSMQGVNDVAFCFHISAEITPTVLETTGIQFGARVDILLPEPNTDWLRTEAQLAQLGQLTRQTFEKCIKLFPEASEWHLFCAVPAPAAVVIGQQINPTMTPRVHLYEFTRVAEPTYWPSLCLGRHVPNG